MKDSNMTVGTVKAINTFQKLKEVQDLLKQRRAMAAKSRRRVVARGCEKGNAMNCPRCNKRIPPAAIRSEANRMAGSVRSEAKADAARATAANGKGKPRGIAWRNCWPWDVRAMNADEIRLEIDGWGKRHATTKTMERCFALREELGKR